MPRGARPAGPRHRAGLGPASSTGREPNGSCSYQTAEWWEAAQRGSARRRAHLDEERHGRDLPAWLLPAEQVHQVVGNAATQRPGGTMQLARDTLHLSGRGKKTPSTLSRAGKPLLRLTHRGLAFPHHPSPRERQCPTPASCFWGEDWRNTLPALKLSLPLQLHPAHEGLMAPRLCPWPSGYPALCRWAAAGGAACRQGTPALWEVAAPVHPPLPRFSSLLGHPAVASPSRPQPRGLCGAPRLQGRSGRGSGSKGAVTWPADPLRSGGSQG